MTRFVPPDPTAYSPEQARIAADIAGGPRGGVRGPLAMWLHRPELADAAQRLGAYCRYGSSLPPYLSELAILVTAQHWQADYEWAAHEPPARAAGLSDKVIAALRIGETPEFETEDAAATHAFACAMLRNRQVDDATFARAEAALGREGLVDLTGILGYYGLISMTLTAFEIGAAKAVFSA